MRTYVRHAMIADLSVAAVAAIAAVEVRFGDQPNARYLLLSLALPVLWVIAVGISGGVRAALPGRRPGRVPPGAASCRSS